MTHTTSPKRTPLHGRHGWLRALLWAALPALLLASRAMAQTPVVIITTEKAAKEGSVWGGLVYASDVPPAERHTPSGEFPDLPRRLARVFPYRHFEVLGEHNQVIFRQYESWVVPSKDFFLKLDSKGIAPRGGLFVHLQFWQGQNVLVKMDAVLRPNSPLFIAGPKWRHGRLIFVLELRKVEPRMRP